MLMSPVSPSTAKYFVARSELPRSVVAYLTTLPGAVPSESAAATVPTTSPTGASLRTSMTLPLGVRVNIGGTSFKSETATTTVQVELGLFEPKKDEELKIFITVIDRSHFDDMISCVMIAIIFANE